MVPAFTTGPLNEVSPSYYILAFCLQGAAAAALFLSSVTEYSHRSEMESASASSILRKPLSSDTSTSNLFHIEPRPPLASGNSLTT